MLINSFYSSLSPACGSYIFNRHLSEALLQFDIHTIPFNIRTLPRPVGPFFSVVHYVPSGFIAEHVSREFIQLLDEIHAKMNLCVVVHGIHSPEETRFRKDGISRYQEDHVRMMCQTASSVIALSRSATEIWHTWQARFGTKVRVIEVPHPGLFREPEITADYNRYALVGGISRPKKDHASRAMDRLIRLCERKSIKVWQHWTNTTDPSGSPLSWRRNVGLVSDAEWGKLVANAKVVLCPYETKVQTVSGVISEAISANRFVLSTSFDAALEMRQKKPRLVLIEDDLDRWPDLIRELPIACTGPDDTVPTWKSFAETVAGFASIESIAA